MQAVANNIETLSRGTSIGLNESIHPEKTNETCTSNSPGSSTISPTGTNNVF